MDFGGNALRFGPIDKIEIEKNYKFAYKLIIAKNIEELQEIETAIQPLIDKGILVKASAN